jgi:hypothetical protein
VAPLVVQELAKACMSLPIAFTQQNDAFVPHALQGFTPGRNMFVVNGKWVAPYTEGRNFFDEDGQPSQAVMGLLGFLT